MEKAPKANCDDCTLKSNPFVASENNGALIVVLAEAPGGDEVKQGRPLVGVAGQILNIITLDAGGKRKEFNFVNSCSCRAMNGNKNRNPTKEEIDCCNERMKNEIISLNPLAIVCLGGSAYYSLFKEVPKRYGDVVGTEAMWNGIKVFITYHPAKVIYEGGTESFKGRETSESIEEALSKALKLVEDRQPRLIDAPEKPKPEVYSMLEDLKTTCQAWYGDKLDKTKCNECPVKYYCWGSR